MQSALFIQSNIQLSKALPMLQFSIKPCFSVFGLSTLSERKRTPYHWLRLAVTAVDGWVCDVYWLKVNEVSVSFSITCWAGTVFFDPYCWNQKKSIECEHTCIAVATDFSRPVYSSVITRDICNLYVYSLLKIMHQHFIQGVKCFVHFLITLQTLWNTEIFSWSCRLDLIESLYCCN